MSLFRSEISLKKLPSPPCSYGSLLCLNPLYFLLYENWAPEPTLCKYGKHSVKFFWDDPFDIRFFFFHFGDTARKYCDFFPSFQNKIVSSRSLENGDLRSSTYNGKYHQQKPNSIPGLRVLENNSPGTNQSTPTSDESNSPTELNIYKRLLEKPPLIKRVPVSVKDMLHEEGFPSTRPAPEGCISLQKESSAATSPGVKRNSKTADIYGLR